MGFQFVNSGYERVQQGLIAPDVFDQAVFKDIINHLMIHSFRKQLKNQTNYEQLTLPISAKKAQFAQPSCMWFLTMVYCS